MRIRAIVNSYIQFYSYTIERFYNYKSEFVQS